MTLNKSNPDPSRAGLPAVDWRALTVLTAILLIGPACGRVQSDRQTGGQRLSAPAPQAASTASIPVGPEHVLARLPHDPEASTQGLQFWNGHFIESTGGYGTSSLRLVEPESGRVLQREDLPRHLFGEGCAWTPAGIYQLTWRNRMVYLYDPETLQRIAAFRYPREGWGLLYDGEFLWAGDGSHRLYRLHPETLRTEGEIEVRTRDGRPVERLNEMAWVEGRILANVFMENHIVEIDPDSGLARRKWDLSRLVEEERPSDPEHVLNGIAYDPETGRLWITGKRWRQVYQVELPD